MFVTTKVVTTVDKIIDGKTSNYADVSVVVTDPQEIQLVIGAAYAHRQCCYFDKETLQHLIDDLQELHDAEWIKHNNTEELVYR